MQIAATYTDVHVNIQTSAAVFKWTMFYVCLPVTAGLHPTPWYLLLTYHQSGTKWLGSSPKTQQDIFVSHQDVSRTCSIMSKKQESESQFHQKSQKQF